MAEQRAVRIVGDGLAWSGRCQLTNVLFKPSGSDQYVKVYDGRDATGGKLVFELLVKVEESKEVNLGEGVCFSVGIYIDAQGATDATTVIFKPLE